MRTVLSCVIDRQPKYVAQSLNWLDSLDLAGVGPGTAGVEVLVHHVPGVDPEHLRRLARRGATLVPVERFGSGPAGYCNKLRQLETPAVREADRVVLSDADVLVIDDPRTWFTGSPWRAKIVDVARPSLERLAGLWARAGLPAPELRQPDFSPRQSTFPTNCNGGMLLFTRAGLERLRDGWLRWARFALAQHDLLGEHTMHGDQLGLAMAAQEAGIEPDVLDVGQNFPTHGPRSWYERLAPRHLGAVHYHRHVDAEELPAPVGVAWIDDQLAAATARIVARRGAGVGLPR